MDTQYGFDGPKGKASVLDLSEGRRRCFEPGVHGYPEHGCVGCSMMADQVAHLVHLNTRDTTLAYASRAPQPDVERLKARMGWQWPWTASTPHHGRSSAPVSSDVAVRRHP